MAETSIAVAGTELAAFVRAVGARVPTPGGGAVAGVVVALAAALAEMAARYAEGAGWDSVVGRSAVLSERGLALAEADVEVYRRYRSESRRTRGGALCGAPRGREPELTTPRHPC